MDKLKPFLEFHFWALLVIVMGCSVGGWWMATGTLQAEIDERTKVLDGIAKGVDITGVPSPAWAAELGQINSQQDALVKQSRLAMWRLQRDTMKWPKILEPYMKKISYRGDFDRLALDVFRIEFPTIREEVWRRVRPVIPNEKDGIVQYPLDLLPVRASWGQALPTSREMWDVQEDIWTLQPLFDAIVDINGGRKATRIDACLHRIERLDFLAGNPAKLAAPAPASMQAGATAGGAAAPLSSLPRQPMVADFNPAEEFGEPPAPAQGQPARRYVDDGTTTPYKTRGFYMVVWIDHRKVSEFVGRLMDNEKSPYPIRVVRYHIQRVNEDDPSIGRFASGPSMGAPSQGGGASGGPAAGPVGPAIPIGPAIPMGPAPAVGPGFTGGESAPAVPDNAELGTGSEPMEVLLPNERPVDSFAAAIADPNICRLALAGLMYLYNPPTDQPDEVVFISTDPTKRPVSVTPAPGTPAPGTPAPGTPAPGTPAPGTPAPGTPAPGIPAPGTPAPGTPAPGTPAPGTPAPGTPAPGTPAPGTPAPGTPAPGTPAPGTPAPGTPAPGIPAPGIPAPGTPAPGTPAPGTPAPGTPAPGTPAPGTPAPGTPAPGTPAAPSSATGLDTTAPKK